MFPDGDSGHSPMPFGDILPPDYYREVYLKRNDNYSASSTNDRSAAMTATAPPSGIFDSSERFRSDVTGPGYNNNHADPDQDPPPSYECAVNLQPQYRPSRPLLNEEESHWRVVRKHLGDAFYVFAILLLVIFAAMLYAFWFTGSFKDVDEKKVQLKINFSGTFLIVGLASLVIGQWLRATAKKRPSESTG